VIKDDVVTSIIEFHFDGSLPRESIASFRTLIPKRDIPQGLGDFKPMPLIRCFYKFIAKILAKRLKKVISGIVDESWVREICLMG